MDARIKLGWFDAAHLHQNVFGSHAKDPVKGGLRFTEGEYLQLQRNAAWDVLSKWGSSLLDGDPHFTSVSLPIEVYEPLSLVERRVIGFLFGPTFLKLAAETKDPMQRIQYLMCFVVGGLHLTPTQRMAFNPAPGEYFRCSMDDGTSVYVECCCDSAPELQWTIEAADGSFKVQGSTTTAMRGGGNSMTCHQKGDVVVSFPRDGGQVVFDLPTVHIGGLLWGDRFFDHVGSIHFSDVAHNLEGTLNFKPTSKSWLRVFDRFRSSVKRRMHDVVDGQIICKDAHSGIAEVTVSGSWLDHLAFNGKIMWELGREKPSSIIPELNPTSMSSMRRPDIQALVEGNLELAEELKEVAEEQQKYLARVKQSQEKDAKTSLAVKTGGHKKVSPKASIRSHESATM